MAISRRDFVRRLAVVGVGAQAIASDWVSAAATTTPADATTRPATRVSADAVELRWLNGTRPAVGVGTTFGVSWPRGAHAKEQTFALGDVPIQTWPLAYWPDGSVKWTAHAAGPDVATIERPTLTVGASASPKSSIQVAEHDDRIEIDTGATTCVVPRTGEHLVSEVRRDGKPALSNARLVCLRQDAIGDAEAGDVKTQAFASRVDHVTVEQNGPVRAVVRLEGFHFADGRAWLPFTVRLYFYAGSDAIRVMHTFAFDGDEKSDFIRGLGVRFDVPMTDLPHDRHVRFGANDAGVWGEAVRGLTGLRRDPGKAFVDAQVAGAKCPPISELPAVVRDRLQFIPAWDGYSLFQSSSDAFAIRKRTGGKDVGWIGAGHGSHANGLGFIGGASGGIAFGVRDFWQRHPTELAVSGATSDRATVTMWLYSPSAPAMDLRFYHDDMGMTSHAEELRGLEITYEDYEHGFGTPVGIARSSEMMLWALPATPTRERFVALGDAVQEPAVLVCAPEHYHASEVFAAGMWALPDRSTVVGAEIEKTLDWYVDFYGGQVEQRKWYGFWDYGDVMHTYDPARHVWRYDVGGFAWDNSELSPDLWLWYSFLRTGSRDVFRFAEAMTRHTGEVDVYHLGRFKGNGTRHGVQHWGDSAKQLRISTVLYRRFYYYLTGGDERVGDLMREQVTAAPDTFLTLDPTRKIRKEAYKPEPHALAVGFGTDWGSLAGAWLTEYERTGDVTYRDKLLAGMRTIAAMPHGFFTGSGAFDPATGAFANSHGDEVSISHLSAVFGLPEICAELIQLFDVPTFTKAWVDYCTYYNAPDDERAKALGFNARSDGLRSAHSRLTAYAAYKTNDARLAARAWDEFFGDDARWAPARYSRTTKRIEGPNVVAPIDEAAWVSTNDTAQWGLSAIECLSLIPRAIPATLPTSRG